jgi:large subunit ribosomal protein L24
MKIRAEDNVLVIKGRDRGKQARVTRIFPKQGKIMVEGVNVVTRHTKPTGTVRQAGRIQKEMPMQASNVMLVCTHCGRPTRISSRVLADGTKARVCTRQGCGEVIE